MPKWPDDPRTPVSFDDLIEPAVSAILQAYRLHARSPVAIDWRGPPLAVVDAACCVDGFDADGLAFNRGVDLERRRSHSDLRTVLGHLIRVSIEQGRRLERSER